MTDFGPYEVHPFADEFPLVEGDEFAELVADVKQQGLREPIVLTADGSTIVDGRNRYLACVEAGVDPVFDRLPERYTERMIADYIVSVNVERRHMNRGQLAMVATVYEKIIAADPDKDTGGRPIGDSGTEGASRQAPTASGTGDGPGHRGANVRSRSVRKPPADLREVSRRDRESSTKAAKKVGASGRAVQTAKAVQRDAPDLAKKVQSGVMSLDAADRERKQRNKAVPQPESSPKPARAMLTLRTHDGTPVLYPEPKKAVFNWTPGEGISWADWSWNPVTGCLHGCDYCYARELATRPGYSDTYPVGFTPLFHRERLAAPANTKVPAGADATPSRRRVFVCSMADLYGRWVPDDWITQVHTSCSANPQWDYLMLTKFPARYVGLDLPATSWLGTSVDEQKRVRIAEDAFRQVGDVSVKWLSLEPLRAPLEFTDLSMFDWVVIGAQTETRQPDGVVPAFAPPFEWVARLVAQAREAGCKVHLKPNLLGRVDAQLPGMQLPDEYPEPRFRRAGYESDLFGTPAETSA